MSQTSRRLPEEGLHGPGSTLYGLEAESLVLSSQHTKPSPEGARALPLSSPDVCPSPRESDYRADLAASLDEPEHRSLA